MSFLISLLPFARKYWREGLILGLVLALAAACAVGVHHLKADAKASGVAQERNRVADSTLKVVIPPLWKADTLLQRDTVRVPRTIARLDTVRDTLLKHLTDTVLVKEFVTRADSAAQACTELAHDCAQFRAYATETIAALQSKVDNPPPIVVKSCVAPSVVSGVIGVAAGFLAGKR